MLSLHDSFPVHPDVLYLRRSREQKTWHEHSYKSPKRFQVFAEEKVRRVNGSCHRKIDDQCTNYEELCWIQFLLFFRPVHFYSHRVNSTCASTMVYLREGTIVEDVLAVSLLLRNLDGYNPELSDFLTVYLRNFELYVRWLWRQEYREFFGLASCPDNLGGHWKYLWVHVWNYVLWRINFYYDLLPRSCIHLLRWGSFHQLQWEHE